MTEPERLLTKTELAERLGVKRKTFELWMRRGMPSVVYRVRILHVESMVRQWMAQQDWIRVTKRKTPRA